MANWKKLFGKDTAKKIVLGTTGQEAAYERPERKESDMGAREKAVHKANLKLAARRAAKKKYYADQQKKK